MNLTGVQNADTVPTAPQMDPPLRSNGSNTRPSIQATPRSAGRSKVAGRADRVLNTALAGERAAVLNVRAAELLAEPPAAASGRPAAGDRPGLGGRGLRRLHGLCRRS